MASAIRIHNAEPVTWKGSRSCSSKPFQIICYIASSSQHPTPCPPLPQFFHTWLDAAHIPPFPLLLQIPTLELTPLTHHPVLSPDQHLTTHPMSFQTGPVSQWWLVDSGYPEALQHWGPSWGARAAANHQPLQTRGCPNDCICQAATLSKSSADLITDN